MMIRNPCYVLTARNAGGMEGFVRAGAISYADH